MSHLFTPVKIALLAGLVAIPLMLGANCAPADPLGPQGDPAGAPLPDVNVDPSSGQPLPRAPQPGDVATISATKSFALTGVRLGIRNTIPMAVTLLPPEVDPSFLALRITKVQDSSGGVLWQLLQAADVAPNQYGEITPLSPVLTFEYVAPDLVFETLKVTIVVSAPLAGQPGIPGLVPANEFVLGSQVITLLPPDAPLTVLASAMPQAITVDGNGGASATTATLRAEIFGGKFIPGSIYEVFWSVQGAALTPAGSFEPVSTEDVDGDGVDDLIVSEKSVTANELEALAGTGVLLLNVTARDAVGTEVNDVAYITVNAPLAVSATMTPEVFVGDGELRTLLNANVSGGAGGYRYLWTSDPVIPGLFDEVDTTAQYISFRARDVQDLQVSFIVAVTDAAGNTATAVARRGGGEDPNPPAPIPGQLVASIVNPPTCAVIDGVFALDGHVAGGVEPIDFKWTGACGTFSDATAEDTQWTAPGNAQTCAITFTATDKNGLAKSQTIAVKVAEPKVMFAAGSSKTAPEAVADADPDGHKIGLVLALPAGCALQVPVTVDVADTGSGTALADADYTALAVPTTVTFPAGSVSGDIQYMSLSILDENLDEDDETVVLRLENPTGGAALGSPASHVATITDDDDAVLTIAGVSQDEGDSGQTDFDFVVSLSNPSVKEVRVEFSTLDGTATAADNDYVAQDGVVTFPAFDNTDQVISIKVRGDGYYENNETFRVKLDNAVNAAIASGASTATGEILNDDSAPEIRTAGFQLVEGNSGSGTMFFNVRVVGQTKLPVRVSWATEPGDDPDPTRNATPASTNTPSTADDDYRSGSGRLTILPGEGPEQIPVTIYGDTFVEKNEFFLVRFTNPQNATIPAGHDVRKGVIRNDDGAIPGIDAIPDVVAVVEGGADDTFEVALALTGEPPTGDVVVSFNYDSTQISLSQDSVTFNAGNYTAPVVITVSAVDDNVAEGPQVVSIALNAASTDPAYNGLTGAVQVKIAENNVAGVIVSAPNGPAVEGGTDAEYTLVLATEPTADVLITLHPDDQASVSPSTLLFTPADWSTPQTVTVTAIDDAVVEGPHTTTIGHTASSTDGFYNNIVIAAATVEITDNDISTLNVLNPADVPEGDTGTGLAIFTITLTPPSLQTVTVEYQTLDGAGASPATVADNDYEAESGVLTFIPGEVSKQVFVRVNGDTKVEDDERFRLRIANATNAVIGTAVQNIRILNDDSSVISIADVAAVEGSGGMTPFEFKVTLSKPSATPITVDYTTAPHAAGLYSALPVDDYDPTGGSIVIPPGAVEGLIVIPVVGDINDEPNETFVVNITTPTFGASIGDGEAIGTILDDDGAPTLSIIADGQMGMGLGLYGEAVGTANFTVTLLPASNQLVTVVVSTQDGTATVKDGDYVAKTETLEFLPGETSKVFGVEIIDDTLDEGLLVSPETFFVLLSSPVNATIQSGFEKATAYIVDNDGKPTVTLTSLINVAEGDVGETLAVVRVDLDAPSDVDFAISYSTEDGTAVAGDDYVATFGQIHFVRRSRTAYIFVPVIGDELVEADETFRVVLQPATLADIWRYTGVGAAARTAVVTIVNDDKADIAINDVRVNEGAGTADLTVSLSRALAPGQPDLSVDYVTVPGTAAGGGVDYEDAAGSVSFPADGVTRTVTITVDIVDDALACEGDEDFFVELANASAGTIVDAQGKVTIVDNDGQPALAVASVGPAVEGSALEFEVTLTGECTQDVMVTVSTAHGTAGAADYTGVSQMLTFPANGGSSQTQSLFVNTLADAIDEADETVLVNLTNPVNAVVTVAQAVGTIIDNNDPPRLFVNNVIVEEGDNGQTQAIFVVRLNTASELPVSVRVDTMDGDGAAAPANTATAPDDYTAISNLVLTFPPGEIYRPVIVQIRGDRLYEDFELFSVNLSNPVNAVIQDGTGIGRIARSDVPEVSIDSDVARPEGNGVGTRDFVFRVRISNPIAPNQSDLTVNVAVNAQTATEGSDYTVPATQVVFPADGSTTVAEFVVLVNRDNVNEPNETFEVRLTGVASGVGTIAPGEARSRMGTIVNDDGEPQLLITGATANESDATLSFTVDLVGAATEQTVTVNWATADGTAQAGADYVAASGLLTFAPGTTSLPVTVELLDDAVYEGTEQFFVTLFNSTHAAIATPQAAGVILDDEGVPTVSIEPQAGLTVVEGDTGEPAVLFNLVLSHASASEVTVLYATADGTATGGVDYVPVATDSVVFAPGVTSLPLAVYVISDINDEWDETFDVQLTSAIGATIGTGSQTITIEDDDPEPSLSINDMADTEGSGGGTKDFIFLVTLSTASGKTVSVTVNTAVPASGIVATPTGPDADYVPIVDLVLTFLPGETSKQVAVAVVKDNTDDPFAERFDVVLSNPIHATIAKAVGQGTIIDDDFP